MENIDSDLIRGNIDTIILKTMLDGDKYGLDIIKEVEQRSNGTYELKQPTLYSCLKRLENQELISSYWLDSDIGGRRHYYKLTEKGHEQLTKKQEEWSRSKFIIDNLLSNYNYDDYRLVSKEDYDRIIEGKQFVYNNPEPVGQSRSDLPANEEPATNLVSEAQPAVSETVAETESLSETFSEQTTQETQNLETEPLTQPETLAQAENLSGEQTDRVYVSNSEPVQVAQAQSTEPAEDLRKFENNILASLRSQENEEINTYVGDKNSYINQLHSSEVKILPAEDNSNIQPVDYEVVQENLLGAENPTSHSELDNHINEFSESVSELNKFLSKDHDAEPEVEPVSSTYDYEHTENAVAENFDKQNAFEENANAVTENDNENYGDVSYNNSFEKTRYASDVLNPQDDDYLDDLELLKNNQNSGYFANLDNDEYSGKKFETAENLGYEEPNVSYTAAAEEDFSEHSGTQFNEYESEISNETETAQETSYVNDFSQFDNIISQNVNDYTVQSNMFNDETLPNFRETHRTENYKSKLSGLNEYAKTTESPAEPPKPKNSKDMATLKQEFEKEGIEVKQFKKYYRSEEAVKSYLLINKINLIDSLILLFGFMFILSAVFVILRNTDYGKSFDLNFKYFLIGFVPFAVYTLIYLTMYIINPYRKVTSKYAPRIMLFISVIITVQLLLITYCVNLQLGFYSFTQSNYNHLLWIIPAIISFAPIVNNLIYMSLFYSKNFNV